MQQEHLLAQILAQYPLGQPHLTHLGTLWNTTYRVVAEDGTSYNLRLCNPRFQDRQCLHDELVFLDFVAKRGQVGVPQPVLNRHNALVTVVSTPDGDRLSCLFTWIEGQEARSRLTHPVLYQMGQSVAFLHKAAQSYIFPSEGDGFRESYVYDDKLLLSHHEWIAECAAEIGSERVALLHKAIDAVLAALTATLGHAGRARGNPRGARAHTDGGQPSVPWLTVANLDALGRAEDLRPVTGVGRRA